MELRLCDTFGMLLCIHGDCKQQLRFSLGLIFLEVFQKRDSEKGSCFVCFLVTPINQFLIFSWEVYIVHSGVFAGKPTYAQG